MGKTLNKLLCGMLLLGSLGLKSAKGKTLDDRLLSDDSLDFPRPNDRPYYQKADLIQDSSQICSQLKGQLLKESFFYDGIERTFWTYIPSSYKPFESNPASLILVFHGHGGDGLGMMNYVGFNELAEADGKTIIIAPDGTGIDGKFSWNAYHCCGYGLENNVDDVGFIKQLIEYARVKYDTDGKASAVGHSNGGMLTYKLASLLSDKMTGKKIKAIADVSGCSGGKSQPEASWALPTKPEFVVPVMMVHGMLDAVIPFDGCEDNCYREDLRFYEGLKLWRDFYGFQWLARQEYSESGDFLYSQYTSQENGEKIYYRELIDKRYPSIDTYIFPKAGHEWPLVDNSTSFITKKIWNFFKKHSEKRKEHETDEDDYDREDRAK